MPMHHIDQQGDALILHERGVDDDGEECNLIHHIHLGLIASDIELLGYTDAVDCVDAIVKMCRPGGEPAPDPETGEKWSDGPWLVLAEREKSRERAAFEALGRVEGAEPMPQSSALRSRLAARKAVLGLTGGESDQDSVLEKCRDEARKKCGAPTPRKKQPMTTLCSGLTCSPEPDCDGDQCLDSDDREQIAEKLRPLMFNIQKRRRGFLHSLTGNLEDPLPVIEPGEGEEDRWFKSDQVTLQSAVLNRYQQEET